MNQSSWFSLDDKLIEQKAALDIPVKPPKENLIIDMNEILAGLALEQLEKGVAKYLILAGEGEKCNAKSKVRIICEERDSTGQLAYPNRPSKQLTRISLASSTPMIQGLRIALLSMSENEEAWFKVSDEWLSDNPATASPLPQGIRYYRITMVSIQQPAGHIDSNTIQGKQQQLQKFRNDGNEHFKNKQFQHAESKYRKGINFLEKWPKHLEEDPAGIKLKKEYYLIFCGNIAQCYMYENRINDACIILEDIVEQTRSTEFETKTYYRLIKCLLKLDEIEKAKRYYKDCKYICKLTREQEEDFIVLEAAMTSRKLRKKL